MREEIDQVLLTAEAIALRVAELGKRISADYRGKDPVIVGVLRGAVVFLSDLIRCMDIPLRLDFTALSSYGSGSRGGKLRWRLDVETNIAGADVLVVEDIVDSGRTLELLLQKLKNRNPGDLKVCALLNKPARRETDVALDYIGFEIPDRFVAGYGLDYAGRYRNLPYIATLKKPADRSPICTLTN